LHSLNLSIQKWIGILQDPKFAEWIKGSKSEQTCLYTLTNSMITMPLMNYLRNWKERNQVVQQTAQAEKVARKSAVQSANYRQRSWNIRRIS
jgi:hypothetical protein